MFDPAIEWLQSSMQSSTFLTIGVISLVVLIVGFIADGIFDAFDFGDGPLSLTTLGAFGAMFGFVGFSAIGFGANVQTAILIGAVIGILGAVGAWSLSKIFKKTSSSASISSSSTVGSKATVTLRIPENGGAGEIAYFSGGMRHTFIAYSKEAIPNGETVIIESLRSGNSVNVVKEENYKSEEKEQTS